MPAAPSSAAEPKPQLLAPAANYENIVAMGVSKASSPAGKIFLLGIQVLSYYFYILVSAVLHGMDYKMLHRYLDYRFVIPYTVQYFQNILSTVTF